MVLQEVRVKVDVKPPMGYPHPSLQLVQVKHACKVFALFWVSKEGLAQVVDKDKHAWDDGEVEVGVRDELGNILLKGGETEITEQTSSPKKSHHQPGVPRLAPQEPMLPPNQHGFTTGKSHPIGKDVQLPTKSHHSSTPLKHCKTNPKSLAAWSNVAPAMHTQGSSTNKSSSRRAPTANAEKPCRSMNTS